jgi:Protein of unknown function (DUF3006)
MSIRLSVDRFEGEKKQIGVLLTDDGTPINFPKALLPKGVKAGEILTFQIEREVKATRDLAAKPKVVRDLLKKAGTSSYGASGLARIHHQTGDHRRSHHSRRVVAALSSLPDLRDGGNVPDCSLSALYQSTPPPCGMRQSSVVSGPDYSCSSNPRPTSPTRASSADSPSCPSAFSSSCDPHAAASVARSRMLLPFALRPS